MSALVCEMGSTASVELGTRPNATYQSGVLTNDVEEARACLAQHLDENRAELFLWNLGVESGIFDGCECIST